MNIAIIGAGYTGLTAAYCLLKQGHHVTIFEQGTASGGLAGTFQLAGWNWPLEQHYHHIFATDKAILSLAKEVGIQFKFTTPETSSLVGGATYRFDSPLQVLLFPRLSLIERLRMGAILAYLKYNPNWKSLERYTAAKWLPKAMGQRPYRLLWEPLLKAKFGEYFSVVSLAWFWARIKARTAQLGYPEGGFAVFTKALVDAIIAQGGIIYYDTAARNISPNVSSPGVTLTLETKKHITTAECDQVLVTTPHNTFARIAPALPEAYRQELMTYKGIGAVTMALQLKEPFFTGGTYWLNICDKGYPFLAVVDHTNFIDASHYDNNHVVYIANYVPSNHRYMKLTDHQLYESYLPHLDRLHKQIAKKVLGYHVFRAPFAQPIMSANYSMHVLPIKTPLKNVYLANMQQIYPWDRGTNFAVELGKKAAHEIMDYYTL